LPARLGSEIGSNGMRALGHGMGGAPVPIPLDPPNGTSYTPTAGGFIATASFRTRFHLVAAAISVIATIALGFPMVEGMLLLIFWAAPLIGYIRLKRDGDDFEIFTGAGPIGIRRRCCWSKLRDSHVAAPSWIQRFGAGGGGGPPLMVLDGTRWIKFGGLLPEERRYFLLRAIRNSLDGG